MSGDFQAVSVVGGIVPPGLLGRIQSGDVRDPSSLSAASYGLAGGEGVRDAAARAWSYLRGAWEAWRAADVQLPTGNVGTGPARDKWLLVLLRELGYGQVPAHRGALRIDEHDYPISHHWNHVQMHLLGPRVELDRRNPGVPGAARAPQAMVQELLNRSDSDLWAILSNGLRLRLLRDSTSLAGSAFLEFDLEAIFDGELYPEFLMFWQLTQFSRLDKRGGPEAPPSDCWIEAWRGEAVDAGTRALDKLRDGVQTALQALGSGFLRHPDNRWLVDALHRGELSDRDLHRALLRLAYRLLFVFVAEDRDALLDPEAPALVQDRYRQYFSTARLRRLSRRHRGGPHPDLWRSQRLILQALGGRGRPELGVPALGGLFDPDRGAPVTGQTTADLLLGAELANADLLAAIRALGWVTVKGSRVQPVDYRHLGAEELGSVYESLLELVPRVDLAERRFTLEHVSGNERKTTGSYYTPPALVSALLDTALDPLLDDAVKNADNDEHAEQRLLAITVCDPACGSGGFLVAAARRIARRVAQLRSGEDEPTPVHVQHALRDVVGRCIYGVDLNDLAAELAKVSLWLEALEPGKPLGFLDARIRIGNSLLGTTPALLAGGVPDAAFKEIEGDDKKYAASIRKRNKQEAGNLAFHLETEDGDTTTLRKQRRAVLTPASDDIDAIRAQAQAWRDYEHSDTLEHQRLHADAWCAAFVWPLRSDAPTPPTNAILDQVAATPDSSHLADTIDQVHQLTGDYRFFHWHLEFPEIFNDPDHTDTGPEGWTGGFTCLLGNPPWERVKLQEQEFFAARDPDIAKAPNAAARRRLIAALKPADPPLYQAFVDERRRAEGQSVLLRTSGRYPLNGRGDVNTYAVFAELFRSLTGPKGQSGIIVPTGIATDASTQHFISTVIRSDQLIALLGFYDRKQIFQSADVHGFCLLIVGGRLVRSESADFSFFLRSIEELELPERRFKLTAAEVTLLNPNTGTVPIFRTRRDAEITLAIYKRVPVLVNENDPINGNPWGVSFMRMFDMTNDSHLFRTRQQLDPAGWTLKGNVFHRGRERMLPLLEAKMIHQYDHRWATYRRGSVESVADSAKGIETSTVEPRWWIDEGAVTKAVGSRTDKEWLICWRDIARATDERTSIATIVPRIGVANSLAIALPRHENGWLIALAMNSFVFDFVTRLKVGGTHLNYFIVNQLPIAPPNLFTGTAGLAWLNPGWFLPRCLELLYTSQEMEPFARDVGDLGPPFVWDPHRRFLLRAEVDAAMFIVYGVEIHSAAYILDSFRVALSKDEQRFGDRHITKKTILGTMEAMQSATKDLVPYESAISPPPGHGLRHPEQATR